MAQKTDRTTWKLTKYSFRTGETVEFYPKLIKGEGNAHCMSKNWIASYRRRKKMMA